MDDGYDEYCRRLIAQAANNEFEGSDRSVACDCADYLNATSQTEKETSDVT